MRFPLLIVLLAALLVGSFFWYGPPRTTNRAASGNPLAVREDPPLTDLSRQLVAPLAGREVILLLGKAGAGWTAGELTDTILLVILNGTERKATLLSLPRDLLVQYGYGRTAKINALWLIGKQDALARGDPSSEAQTSLIREAVEEITGLTVSEVVVADVAAAERAINALGGIALNVTERIDDPAFPTPGGGTERFVIEPGFQVLDGATAIKYARTRHTPEADFGRLRRQHQVLEAAVAKLRGLNLAADLKTFTEIAAALSDSVETSIRPGDLPRFALYLRDIPFANVQTFALETLGPEPLLRSAGESFLVPRAGTFDYTEIREAVAELVQ